MNSRGAGIATIKNLLGINIFGVRYLYLHFRNFISPRYVQVAKKPEPPDWAAAAYHRRISAPKFGTQRGETDRPPASRPRRRRKSTGPLRHRRLNQRKSFSGFPAEGEVGQPRPGDRVYENLTVFECDSGSDSGMFLVLH
jgi:hypothetical protein